MPLPSGALAARDAPLTTFDWLLYGAGVLIFGSGWLPLKMQLGVVAPEVSGVWRFLIASSIMLAVVVARGERLIFPARDHALFAAMGTCLFSLNFVAFYHGGFYLPSGLLSVVLSLTAVLIPLMSVFFFKTPLRANILMGAVAGVIGIAFVFVPSVIAADADASGAGTTRMGLGLIFSFAGTFFFAVGSLLSGVAGRRGLPLLPMTAFSLVYGFLVCLALALVQGQTFMVDWSARYLGSLAYLVVVPTLSGFAVYLLLVRRIGANRAGYCTVLYPLVALALSTFFEDFHWTAAVAFGIALVLCGNVLVLRAGR
jgi:drug/metabolite transporter (DMT)-like permease